MYYSEDRKVNSQKTIQLPPKKSTTAPSLNDTGGNPIPCPEENTDGPCKESHGNIISIRTNKSRIPINSNTNCNTSCSSSSSLRAAGQASVQ